MRMLFTGLFLCGSLIWMGCNSSVGEQVPTDTPEQGAVWISADESFQPIVEELVQVYQSQHPGTRIRIQYKPEADCFRDLFVDSIRMVIVTRRPNAAEEKWITDSVGGYTRSRAVARDGIAVLLHPSHAKTTWSRAELKEVLSEKISNSLIPVVDGLKATSTVRFLIDSVLRGESPTQKLMAARTSQGVIEYVADHPNVIGFVGVGWIGNHEDSLQRIWQPRIRLARIANDKFPDYTSVPDQVNVYTRLYPLTRDITYILKEKHTGLATGLARFMESEVGQLIFKRAYLAPLLKDFGFRPVKLKE